MKTVILFLILLMSFFNYSVIAQQAKPTTRPATTRKTTTARRPGTKTQTKKPLNLRKELDLIKADIKKLNGQTYDLQNKLQQAGGEIFDQLNFQIGELDSSLYTLQMANSTVRIAVDSMISVKFAAVAEKDKKTNERIDELIMNNAKMSKLIIILSVALLATILLIIVLIILQRSRFDRKNRVIIRYLKRLRTDLNQHLEDRRIHLR